MCPLKAHASRCSAPAPHSVSGPESLQTYLTQMSLHWGGAGPNLMSLVSLEKGEIGAKRDEHRGKMAVCEPGWGQTLTRSSSELALLMPWVQPSTRRE